MNLHDFRRQYQSDGLNHQDLNVDPIRQFDLWFNEVLEMESSDPTAMVLATVDQQQPRQRIVLLKQFDNQGFVFFTNRKSTKGKNMAANPEVSLHFPWHFANRQVIVCGTVELLCREEDAEYFTSRPKQSQWAAWASAQSQPLESRQELLDNYEEKKQSYPDDIPLPDFWGGYRVVPSSIEFWQGREDRLHDRFIYKIDGQQQWSIQRLSP